MIGNERVVAIIPARGGSKSVKLKNLHPLGGKPLLAWPIEVAKQTPEIDRVIVSTDHEEIAQCARDHGAEVIMRPDDLASDTAMVADVLRHHITELRKEGETAKYLTLLEATAPFRLPRDVTACLNLLENEGLDSVATFMEAEINPHRTWKIENNHPDVFIEGAVPWKPRQLLPEAHQLNGAVYAFVMDNLPADAVGLLFGKTGAVTMERERSFDIDDKWDFVIANALLEQGFIPRT